MGLSLSDPCWWHLMIALFLKHLSTVLSTIFSTAFPGTEVGLTALQVPGSLLPASWQTGITVAGRDVPGLPRPLVADGEGSCCNTREILLYSGMNPNRPHGLGNTQLIQVVPLSFSVHKGKATVPALMGLQLWGLGTPRSISITKNWDKIHMECLCLFFTPIRQVTIFNKDQSNVFFTPSLAINVFQKAFLLSETALASFYCNWALALDVFSLHRQITAL